MTLELPYLTVEEVAQKWRCKPDAVISAFGELINPSVRITATLRTEVWKRDPEISDALPLSGTEPIAYKELQQTTKYLFSYLEQDIYSFDGPTGEAVDGISLVHAQLTDTPDAANGFVYLPIIDGTTRSQIPLDALVITREEFERVEKDLDTGPAPLSSRERDTLMHMIAAGIYALMQHDSSLGTPENPKKARLIEKLELSGLSPRALRYKIDEAIDVLNLDLLIPDG